MECHKAFEHCSNDLHNCLKDRLDGPCLSSTWGSPSISSASSALMDVDFTLEQEILKLVHKSRGLETAVDFQESWLRKEPLPFSFFVCFFSAWKTIYRTLRLDTHQISPLFRNDMKHVFVEHRQEHGIHLRFLLISMVCIWSSKWVFELVKKSPGDFWEYGVYLSPHRESAMKGIRNSFLFRLVVKGGIGVVGATLQLYGCFLKQS